MKIVKEEFKVYINTIFGQFPDEWAYAAWQGFKNKNNEFYDYEIHLFENKDISNIPFSDNVIVVADIDLTRKYFKLHGINEPTPFNIPDSLNKPEYIGRNIKIMTAQEFIDDRTFPIFVKPHSKLKQFSSGVLSTQQLKRIEFNQNDVQSDDLVLTSNVVDILSEYRCFVRRGKVVGVKHYQGDFSVFPDLSILDKMIKDWKDAPLAYTLDIGVIEVDPGYHEPIEQKTILVEAQDMWSIGHYGLDCREYATCLQTRWMQLIKNRI